MKIGDKVRFLSEVGGGTVTGFQGKDMVLVADEDGFEIPMLIKECIAVETNDYNIAKVDTMGRKQKAQTSSHDEEEEEEDDRPITFHAKPMERKDGDRLNLCLAYVPVDAKDLTNTSFEVYMVNDSNYYMAFTYLTAEGANWVTRFQGVAEPNTKVFLEEFDRAELNDRTHVAVQALAYKQDKTFMLKPVIDVQVRLDAVKFYKLHTFQDTPFFEEPSLLYYLVKDDVLTRQVFVNAEALQEALMQKKNEDRQQTAPARLEQKAKQSGKEVVEVDLHANELLDTTQNMGSADILAYQLKAFHDTMRQYADKKGKKIVFIHGKGEGVLRNAVIKELKTKYKSCTFQDASFQEYGFGATMVTIH